jgi:uncharacterized integral membrane protein (TIGR00697 family)
MTAADPAPPVFPKALLAFALFYGGMVVLAGVLGTKITAIGPLNVESGIFAFLTLVVTSSAIAELYGRRTANWLVLVGFVPLIASMILIQIVIHLPPAPFWQQQAMFATLLGQGSRLMLAGLISYGASQILNVAIFSRLRGQEGARLLWFRALVASVCSQLIDTVLFITIAFYGVIPIMDLMPGQALAKMVLSVVLVPPLIYLFVGLGRRLDATR